MFPACSRPTEHRVTLLICQFKWMFSVGLWQVANGGQPENKMNLPVPVYLRPLDQKDASMKVNWNCDLATHVKCHANYMVALRNWKLSWERIFCIIIFIIKEREILGKQNDWMSSQWITFLVLLSSCGVLQVSTCLEGSYLTLWSRGRAP